MRPNKFKILSFLAILFLGLSLSSCQKDTTSAVTGALSQSDQIKQSSNDDQNVQDAQTAMDNDVTNFISGLSVTKGNGDTIPLGLKVIDSNKVKRIFHIRYNGIINDDKRVKTGDINVQLINGTQWKEAGAEIQFSYNVSVTKASGKTYTLKGIKTITNVTGGLLWGRTVDNTKIITHVIDGKDTITFPDLTTRIWEHKVQRTWQQYTANILTLTIKGLGTSAGYDSLATWGVNRRGNNFYTKIKTPIISTNLCLWFPSKGEVIHTIVSTATSSSASVTLTLGGASNGAAVTSGCAAYYMISWVTKDNKTGTAILPY